MNRPPMKFEDLFAEGNFMDENQNEVNDEVAHGSGTPSIWVFGYGSLCWNPGFEYSKCVTGYIRGFVRRFWQGNITHRGTPNKPGRVATLMQEKEGITWGCAYKITGETALDYLKQRECTLGGYITVDTKFYPRVASYDTVFSGEAIQVVVYIATDQNCHWMGENCLKQVAREIVNAQGPSGHNIEYLLRLAKFMREEIPGADDEHLFTLEKYVREFIAEQEIPLPAVMGVDPARIRRDSHEDIKKPPTFEFTSRIPERKLRCLNI